MACGGCAKRNAANRMRPGDPNPVMGGYKYLTDSQIKARLEVYKRRYCVSCDNKFKCDYVMYVECKKIK